jgi:dUTPase
MSEVTVKYRRETGEDFYGFFVNKNREEISSSEIKLISTGVFLEIPKGYEGSIFRSNSSIPFKLVITPGTIDSDYRGEIKIIMCNEYNEKIILEAGEKIAILKINKFVSLGESATQDSAGTDLKSAEDLEFCGWRAIKLQWLPKMQHNLYIQYRGRSGLASSGLKIQYCSDIKDPILMANSKKRFNVSKGDRIAQVVAMLFERKTTSYFALNHYQDSNLEKIITLDTKLKDCIIEFQVPDVPNAKIEILNNPSCGGIVVIKVSSSNNSCFIQGLFAKVIFLAPSNIKWQNAELSPSDRGGFGSTGI